MITCMRLLKIYFKKPDTNISAIFVSDILITSDIFTSDIFTSDIFTSDIITSDIITSDIFTSDIFTSDIITSDIFTSDIILTSDIITSDIFTPSPCNHDNSFLHLKHLLERPQRFREEIPSAKRDESEIGGAWGDANEGYSAGYCTDPLGKWPSLSAQKSYHMEGYEDTRDEIGDSQINYEPVSGWSKSTR